MPDTAVDAEHIQARHFTKGPRAGPVRGVVIHTMESGETATKAEQVAAWFAGPTSSRASAHWCVDSDSVVASVLEADIAWHAPGRNHDTIGIEHAGRAGQGVAGWADDYSQAMLRLSAKLTAGICRRYDIQPRRLTVDQVRNEEAGIMGHADVSAAFGRSSHWDPGPAFPWDSYLTLVRLELTLVRLELATGPPVPAPAPGPGKLILVPSTVTVEQCVRYVAGRQHPTYSNADVATIARLYEHWCGKVGVDLAVAWAQLVHETGRLTSFWSRRPQRNPAGIGVTGAASEKPKPGYVWNPDRSRYELGIAFPSWERAVPAHVGRLAGYALPASAVLTAPQAEAMTAAYNARPIPLAARGCATIVRHLGAADNPAGVGWASPGRNYGARLQAHIDAIRAMRP